MKRRTNKTFPPLGPFVIEPIPDLVAAFVYSIPDWLCEKINVYNFKSNQQININKSLYLSNLIMDMSILRLRQSVCCNVYCLAFTFDFNYACLKCLTDLVHHNNIFIFFNITIHLSF